MSYRIVDPAEVAAGRGRHPAASPFDKRLSTELGLEAFEVYQVELPPGAESVAHDHIEDRVEDVYVFLRGDGWVVVDDEEVPVEAGTFVAVTVESNRYVRGGDNGLVFVAVCGS